MAVTIADPKTELRRALRARRRDLARLCPSAAEMAAEALPLDQLPPFAIAAGYRAQGGELNPWPTLRRLASWGARITLPVAVTTDGPLIFRAWAEDQPLAPDAARVPAPTDAAQTLVPDLIIAPLLAFDRSGYRLGQGGGYYDRTLETLREKGPVFVIGLAFAGQEVNRVPREAHDQPLDAILTETGYHPIRKDI